MVHPGPMTAYVELRNVARRNMVIETAKVAVDPRDEDDCIALLRSMAKRHKGVRVADLEIRVRDRNRGGEKRYRTF